MKTHDIPCLAAGLIGLALLGGARPARAQVLPGDIDKTQIRPSAYGLGIGGSYLLLGDDPNGLISNPAAVAETHNSIGGLDVAAEGQTSNVNISDLNDLINGLKNLRDQINNANTGSYAALNNVEGSFNKVYNFAVNAGANDSTPAHLPDE